MEIINWLDNRDLSILIWLSLLFLSVLIIKSTRPQVVRMIRIIFGSQIGTVFLLCIVYTMTAIVILQKNGYWEMSLTKEAVVWLLGFAFYSTFKVNDQKNHSKYFRGLVWEAIKLTAILEFASNFYVLSFIGELILIPVVVFISLMIAYSDHMRKEDERHGITSKFFNLLLSCIGLYILYKGVLSFISDPHSLLSWLSLKELLLPIILTIFFIPLLYAIAFYMQFESFAGRLFYLLKKDKNLTRYAKWKTLTTSLFNINRLKKIDDMLKGKFIESKEELNLILSTY